MMNDDDNYVDEDVDQKKNGLTNINKAIAILFVAGIYFVIFLKILFIN